LYRFHRTAQCSYSGKANQCVGRNQPEFGANSAFQVFRIAPDVDEITLVSSSGKPMKRETDLIDVWFDSGAMPYAQAHYPFASANPDQALANQFPADFIAEGVDQTRGGLHLACFRHVIV
jgi:isoleucyl-tRNA synthetase